jgi:hypothetical protein
MTGRAWLGLLFALLVLAATPRAAADEPVRVVVGDVAGKGGEHIRRALVRTLLKDEELYLVSLDYVKKAARARHVELGGDDFKELAGQLGAAAVLEGKVTHDDSGWTCTLRVRVAGDAGASEASDFHGQTRGELTRTVTRTVGDELGPALLDAGRAASKQKKRVALLALTGPKSREVREWVEKAVEATTNVELCPTDEVSALDLPADANAAERKSAAAKLGASALLVGEVQLSRGKASVDLSVKNGKDGESLGKVSLSAKNLKGLERKIDAELATQLVQVLAGAVLAEPPEEEAPVGPDDDDDDKPKTSGGPRPSPLDVRLEFRALSRRFSYSDDLFNRLRAYKLGLGPSLRVAGDWYPLAHFQGGLPANIGVAASYEQSLALKSKLGDQEFSTVMREWFVGLRGRFPFDPYELGVELGYGVHSFTVEDDPIRPLVPDVRYRYIRLGVDGRARFGKAVGGGHLGYRKVSDPGDVGSDRWFPHASAGGLDLGIEGGYEVLTRLDLVAGLDYRRYFLSMNSEPGDANVAGGALDQYIVGYIGAEYRLPGSP